MIEQNLYMEIDFKSTLKNGTILTISQAIPEDARNIIDFLNNIAGESDNLTFGAGEFAIPLDQEKKFLSDSQKSKNSIMIIGKIDHRLVSISNISSSSKQRLEHAGDIGLSVSKEYWHLGVGTAMMQYLIDWAKGRKIIRKLNLSVRTSNQHAIELYKRAGFVEEGMKTRTMFINGKFCDTLEMGMEID